MATPCTCRHGWILHAKGGLGGGCSINDCPCTGFVAGAPSHIYKAPSAEADLAAERESAMAADLWARLVTAWESADGSDDQEQDEFASAVAALVAEWQGFVGAPKAAPPSEDEDDDDDDSAFAFIAHEGLVDEYNAWCKAAPERAQREALFSVWQAELKAAQVAAGCTHPEGICANCKGHGNFSTWLTAREKEQG